MKSKFSGIRQNPIRGFGDFILLTCACACVRNRWRYCGNYPGYLDEDIADDGKDILYIHESGLVNRPSVIM